MAYDVAEVAARFQEDGFALVEGFLRPEEADRLVRELERYVDEVVPRVNKKDVFYETGTSGPISQTGSLEVYDGYFEAFVQRSDLLELVETCVGTPVELLGSEVFFKFPRLGLGTPYHQDNAYMHFEPAAGAAFWIAVDDTTIENGAMHYTRGSFALGDLHHFETGKFPFSKQLAEDALDLVAYPEVPAVLKRGGAAIHHILAPHRAGPNRTDHHRRGYAISFKGANVKVNRERQAAHAAYIEKIHRALGNV